MQDDPTLTVNLTRALEETEDGKDCPHCGQKPAPVRGVRL